MDKVKFIKDVEAPNINIIGGLSVNGTPVTLQGAMKFLGTSSTIISDGSTTKTITVSGSSVTVSAGNVVLYGGHEYVWTGSAWEELGHEGSFKVKQSAVTSPTTSGSTTAFIDAISQDANGKITATKKNVSFPVTSVNNKAGAVTLTKGDIGLGNVDNTADSNKSVKYATTAGSAASATKATQDASGNTITSTYATKSQLANYIENAGDSSDKRIQAGESLYLVSPDVSVVGTLYVAVDPEDEEETDWIDIKEEFSKKVSKSGGTMTGGLEVNAPIFGYNYAHGNDLAAFIFDKTGTHYTGIGANGESDTIYFGAVSDKETGAWNNDHKQKWKFNGSIIADNITGNALYGEVYYETSYGSEASLSNLDDRVCALEGNICLQEGTQILMADGTTKNIENVKYGDMIMTYDIDNNEVIPCKSYGCMFTGYTHTYNHYCFDNGSILKVFGGHRLYDADKQELVYFSKMNIGDHAMTPECVPATYCYSPSKVPASVSTRKFTLFSETGLYFANNILCGHPICQPLDLHIRTHGAVRLSDEDKATLQAYANARDNDYQVELSNPEYIKEAMPFWKEQQAAKRKIEENKEGLAARDYKTIKAMQGKLTEKEIAENVNTCEELRAKINEEEEIVAKNKKKIKALQDKYNIHPRKLQVMETINVKDAIAKARAKYKN